MIRNHLSDEVFEQMGEPIKNLMIEMIKQLRKELGEDFGELDQTEHGKEMKRDIQEIDQLLKNSGNLSESEIDQLLDERAKLKTDQN